MQKPFRDMLLAIEAFNAGSPELLIALRGAAPNKTNAAQPLDAIVRALLAFCVWKLSIGGTLNGGFPVTTAAEHVGAHATTQGLPRTKRTVRGIYYAVSKGGDAEGARWYTVIREGSHKDGDAHLTREDRLTWLRQLIIFAKLKESQSIPITG